ncbi:MAG: leucine-rich repeat protein [Ruminococcus sp.]|nr:leucine-rich repeat protein [Ruminococcus sp.]
MKKKILAMALALSLAIGSVAALPKNIFTDSTSITAAAETESGNKVEGDWEYSLQTIWDDEKEEDVPYCAFLDKYNGKGTDVVLPAKIGGFDVYGIDCNAFSDAKTVKSIKVPATFIYGLEIYAATLESIEVDSNNESLSSVDGIVYDKEKKNLLFCPQGKTSVKVPDGVQTIGESSFYWCKNLKSVSLPDSLKTIGSGAFESCESLASVIIPKGVTEIGEYAFMNCKALESINVDSANKNYTSVDGVLFNKDKTVLIKCPAKKTSVTIPATVNTIKYYAFGDCAELKALNFPAGVEYIGNLKNCKSLESITVDSNNKNYSSDSGILYNKKKTELIICPKQKSGKVVIPDTVEEIMASAFENCKKITDVKLPASLKTVRDNAFNDCTAMKIDKMPNNLIAVSYKAFGNCTNLKSADMPKTLNFLDVFAFDGCTNLTAINIDSENKTYQSQDGVVYTNNKTATYACPNGKTSVSLSGGVKTIGNRSFSGCKKLKALVIPSGVESVGAYAFDRCSSVKSVALPNTVESLGMLSFYDCRSLEQITVPKEVKSIEYGALGYDENGKMIQSFNYEYFSMKPELKENFKIIGYKGSEAEKYAKDYKIKFEELYQPTQRLAGANRYATAVEISKAQFPSSKYVILAYALNSADALAGVPLAKKYNAPILLTATKSLPTETLEEIQRLEATDVIILGGTNAISNDVEKLLKDKGLNTKRIQGTSRFGTATAIADELNKAPEELFFVYAFNFADALSASTVAAINGSPIVYLKTNGSIDADTAKYLASVKGSVKRAYVIGGSSVISDDMMNKAANALGLKVNKDVSRIWGKNRYQTCVEVNSKFKNVLTGNGICIAKGLDFPDALAGGVLAAFKGMPLFLADNVMIDAQTNYLKEKSADSIYIFGAQGAVSDDLVQQISAKSV